MTAAPRRTGSRTLLRNLRLISGLYLLGYVTSHLINLSLGLISIEAMDAARPYLSGIWGTDVTRLILLTALLFHYAIGLWSVYERPRIGGTVQDLVQALSGLAVIPLLSIHAVGVVMLQRAGVDVDYDLIVRIFWLSNPGYGLIQVLLLSVAWVHGAAGFFMWLRSKPTIASALPWIYPLGVAVPVLALLGFTAAGRIVLASGIGPQVVQSEIAPGYAAPEIPFALIIQIQSSVMWGAVVLGVLVLVARLMRYALAKPAVIHLKTKNVGSFEGDTGQTLLDAFRTHGQPHANLCSGRGRCGTCAVRILKAETNLLAPSTLERATLDRLKFGGDVRLACQLPLTSAGALTVERINEPDFSFHEEEETQVSPSQVSA
ncbi:2Fe-2S iron-sulfur cluster binding domain-containing protein [Sulfitobacter sp. SK011]|uniref:2Fe-2S iron-sulfur cluster binding domain-containing protein n=1 Tax=Sulfitobacter sp. SK011 TaxID=1389004 RepID=UPI0019643EE2|nr:2Fe-2S iron-sulfur cluster-binding protein [Sulfitobacter sp. SK011]